MCVRVSMAVENLDFFVFRFFLLRAESIIK